MNNIDVVLTWVDQNDPAWQAEKRKYEPRQEQAAADWSVTGDERYRDWDGARYVLRSIDEFMPWVHRVHFVTWGHLPEWLDTSAPKLNVVRHEDMMDAKYLPTFNSSAIMLNLCHIDGLAEQYVNFNDDTFAIKPTVPEDFFLNGKPRDMACISPQPILRDVIRNVELNNLEIINDHFSIDDIRRNKKKWLDFRNYGPYALRTMLFMRYSTIIGIFEPHIPNSHLRSVALELWEKEFEAHDVTCKNRFRSKLDISEWVQRQWQLVSGNFEPRSHKFGQLVSASNLDAVRDILWKSKCKLVCINDDNSVTAENFPRIKQQVNAELVRLLPRKSSFEL